LKPIEYGLNDILSLKPLSYDQYKYHFPNSQFSLKEGYSPQASIGLIAQEVYDIIPEAVKKPKDENKKIWKLDYTKLIPVLINGIKELNGKNNDLQSENELLKKELQSLKSQFADLDDRLSKAGL
jgi:predicted RNase H-like nuclease (RuvC/YqgF family)